MRFIHQLFFALILLPLFTISVATQNPPADPGTNLLDHLAGHWVMTGTLGHNHVTHDVDADWALKREYLRFHEVSREKDSSGAPAYEAIIFLRWDPKAGEYACLWLDNTEPWDFSEKGIARGKKMGDSIPLVYTFSPNHTMHTTFTYNARAASWRLTIDDITNSKSERFGDVRLEQAEPKPPTP
jgi:hypothetical protein